MTIQTKTAENGVNVAALLGAREALGNAPEAARFKWRASSEWVKGTHSRATVDGFFGLGGEQQHRQTYQFDSDHPEIAALVAQSQKRSAVFDIVTNPTDVTVTTSKA
jgi:hypothetical protein